MSIDTLAIKFRGRGSQDVWLTRLRSFCRELVATGVVKNATVTALFPGHREPVMAGMFTVDVEDAPPDVESLFRPLDGIQYVSRAADRRTLGRTA